MNNKTILITGGTGFIGSNICNYIRKNYNSNIVVIDKTIREQHKFDNVTYIEHDLYYHDNLINLLKDYEFDYIFHEGAIVDTTYNNDDIYMINSYSINSLIKLSEINDAKLIYASSCAIYGNTPIPNTVDYHEEPLNMYANSKLLMDNIVRNYIFDDTRIPIVGLRYSNVYGYNECHKNNMASMIYQLNNSLNLNNKVKLFEFGEQKRDFIYINDIVQYNINSALKNVSGIFNAGYGNSFSFNDMIRFFELYYNRRIDVEFIKNPYKFYQTHTLCNLDENLYEPKYDLMNGINDYLNILNY